MMKYNYLLQSLTGEAKQLANRFQLIEENYEIVVEALKKKFGQDTSIVEDLLTQLESCKAEGTTTKQQRILRKFQPDIQMKALEKRESLEDISEWKWSMLQKHLSQILELKEKIERTQNTIIRRPTTTHYRIETVPKRSTRPCIYCKRTNHPSMECRTVPESSRMRFLIRNHLCLDCGKPNHNTTDCRSSGCFRCGSKHHSSLCRTNATQNTAQRNQERARPQSGQTSNQTQQRIQNGPSNRQGNRGQLQNTPRPVSQNVVTRENEEQRTESHSEDESNVYHVESQKQQKTEALLLTGTANIRGPLGTKKVRILMDTGSELSFIDSDLVNEMQLPIQGRTRLRIKAFGSSTATENEHRIVRVTLSNDEGETHTFEMFDNKRSLFEALGRKVVDEDSLTTVLTEVEACLNEQPLTYQETELDEMTPLRPIDPLQSRLTVTYQIDPCQDDRDDPNFLPAAELPQLRTKKKAVAALKSSCAMVDKFWKTWNEAYLTSLREHHKRYVARGRSSQVSPVPGQVVLLQDPLRPRNTWKMGRITELILEAQINTIAQLKKKDDELEIDSIKFSDDEQGRHRRVVHCSEAGVMIVRDYDVHAAPPECVGSPTPTRRSVGGRSARGPLFYRETDHSQPAPKKARQERR
ncbi:hypothetical protein ANCCAN_16659 [Ancylostoma caninum]|uniref:CCHC-type domain-containing protein n=1 Tax=Ancylostoma caninum TaxID=29170 RepID=A0A368FZA8_ANCCA|nr:hypothetical protein ANCCAN_16659 [Ancylostoma caninum]